MSQSDATPNDPQSADNAVTWIPKVNPWLLAVVLVLPVFMEVLDTSVANVALPHIAGALSASREESSWVLTSYLISNAVILPATAWFGGLFGRKRFLLACIVIFTASSFLCGAATNMTMLVVMRVAQGLGGGALVPIAQAILLESFPPRRRGSAMGLFTVGVIVAPIIGPTLGGWITDNYSWRWVFYINVPIGLATWLLLEAWLEDPPWLRRVNRQNLDLAGFGLMVVWLTSMQVVLDKGQQEDWFASSWICLLTLISVLALGGFIGRELTTDHPIVDLRVLKHRNFVVGSSIMSLFAMALYSLTALQPLFLQQLIGYPALQSGMAVSPRGVGALLAAAAVGPLLRRFDSRKILMVSFTLIGISSVMFGRLNLQIDFLTIVTPNIVGGLGMGLMFASLTTTTMHGLANEEMANASGLYNLTRNLGGSIGISIIMTMLARNTQTHQAILGAHMTPYDPIFMERLALAQSSLEPAMGPAAGQASMKVLYETLQQQASLLAYLDMFRVTAMIAFLCLPLICCLRRSGAAPGAVMTH